MTGEVEIPAAIVLVRFHELPELDVRPTRENIFKQAIILVNIAVFIQRM